MDPLLVAIAGVLVVIVGVLALRLPAFVALVSGALLVASLTPKQRLHDQELRSKAHVVQQVDGQKLILAEAAIVGPYVAFRAGDGTGVLSAVAQLTVSESTDTPSFEPVEGQVQAGDLIIHQFKLEEAETVAKRGPGDRLAHGFGDTCRKIGLLIAMASIIGACLLESGAAHRVVAATRSALGDRHTPVAFAVSGFVVGIPVFFDTVFYLLMPLAKAMRLRTGKNYLLYTLSVVIGASMAHSLVPPTPGPLLVAASLNVSIVAMMLGGTVVGGIAVVAGYLYALWANRRWEIPLREEAADAPTREVGDADDNDRQPPSLWLSLAPILLPVLLLAGGTAIKVARDGGQLAGGWWDSIAPVVQFCGDKNIALTIAAAVALLMLARVQWRSQGKIVVPGVIGPALASGGVIILITGAGGAFGHVLRQAGVAEAIQSRMPPSEGGLTLLVLAFLITAAVRVAQGSATVAMITAVGIVSPLAADVPLPYSPLYLALAIGCGSKPLPWMNDSGFWVVGRMSGMTEAETLKTLSVTLTIMGVVGFLVTLAGAKWLPLI